ncbi:MAG: hypothetical protein P4L48_14815 [Mycobacterium sp.]|nr:hypothetical protein [Mycobacterium sp.]
MADQSDVENALVSTITEVLYPDGSSSAGVLAQTVKIFRGWPNTAQLRIDLAAGTLNVTVFPKAGTSRNTTRWAEGLISTGIATPSLTVNVTGASATFAGSAATGQQAGLLADSLAVVHRTVTGDTPELVAAALAELIRTQRIAIVNGATVTVPGVGLLLGRTVADQPVLCWTRSQLQQFRISCWCPDPTSRDSVASTIDNALSSVNFIALRDGSSGRLRYVATTEFDQSQDAALYRRDLVYSVDYLTTVSNTLPSMIFGDTTLAPLGSGSVTTLLS